MFWDLLIIFFIVFIVWPLIKFFWAIRKAQKQAHRAFEQATGTKWGQHKSKNHNTTSYKEKIFDSNVGEYVEFEEVEHDNTPDNEEKSTSKKFKIEQQVTDAEWEDIK